LQAGIALLFFVVCWLAIKLIHYLKRKKTQQRIVVHDFEGATHKLIDWDAIKKPEVFIEKKARQSGQSDDKDKNNPEENSQA